WLVHTGPAVNYWPSLAQGWLLTVNEVLQADWQEFWQAPQPPLARVSCKVPLVMVLIRFLVVIANPLLSNNSSFHYYFYVLPRGLSPAGSGPPDGEKKSAEICALLSRWYRASGQCSGPSSQPWLPAAGAGHSYLLSAGAGVCPFR